MYTLDPWKERWYSCCCYCCTLMLSIDDTAAHAAAVMPIGACALLRGQRACAAFGRGYVVLVVDPLVCVSCFGLVVERLFQT